MSDKYRTPWTVRSPDNDTRAFDVWDCTGYGKVHHGQWGGEATARLIAAAPDLLAVCKLALNKLPEGDSATKDVIRAVVAMAEGKS